MKSTETPRKHVEHQKRNHYGTPENAPERNRPLRSVRQKSLVPFCKPTRESRDMRPVARIPEKEIQPDSRSYLNRTWCPVPEIGMSFARRLPGQLAVFQGGPSRPGGGEEHISID